MNSSSVVYNNVSQALSGVTTSVQAFVFWEGVILLVVGLGFAILGFFLFSKSKQKQSARKTIGIVLLVFGILGILGGIRGLILSYQVPNIVNNTFSNGGYVNGTFRNSYEVQFNGTCTATNNSIVCGMPSAVYYIPTQNSSIVLSIESGMNIENILFVNATMLRNLSTSTLQNDRFRTNKGWYGPAGGTGPVDIPLFHDNISYASNINGDLFIQYVNLNGTTVYQNVATIAFPSR